MTNISAQGEKEARQRQTSRNSRSLRLGLSLAVYRHTQRESSNTARTRWIASDPARLEGQLICNFPTIAYIPSALSQR